MRNYALICVNMCYPLSLCESDMTRSCALYQLVSACGAAQATHFPVAEAQIICVNMRAQMFLSVHLLGVV